MSFSRNYMSRFPYYTYREHPSWGNGMNSMRLLGAAASPTVAIVVGTNSAPSTTTMLSSGSVIKTSTDGIIWSNVSSTSFGTNSVTQIAYGNNVFVAMGASNTIATSPGTSGTVWTQRTSPVSGTNPWAYLTFQNGYFIAASTTTGIFTSTDGITWAAGASITLNGLTSWQYQTAKGGLFYIQNNPSSARWLQVYGQPFLTTAQTHFALFQDITSSGTISSTYATNNSASYGPQWIPEDNRLLITVSSNSTTLFGGHAASVSSADPISTTAAQNFPGTLTPAGVFYPSVMSSFGQIAIGGSTASSVLSQFSQITSIGSGAGGTDYKKALYVYNDGYYNCLHVANVTFGLSSNDGGIIASPTVNTAFRADDHSVAESVQLIGSSLVPQAGVTKLGSNIAARSGGFERAIDITFKGNSYVFFIWHDNSSYWNQGYLRGIRSIKPLRTTIGLKA